MNPCTPASDLRGMLAILRRTQAFYSLVLGFLITCSLQASEVIQIDVRPMFTGRAVTTFTDGKLVHWTQGVDGGGHGDGYMTREASTANGDTNTLAHLTFNIQHSTFNAEMKTPAVPEGRAGGVKRLAIARRSAIGCRRWGRRARRARRGFGSAVAPRPRAAGNASS